MNILQYQAIGKPIATYFSKRHGARFDGPKRYYMSYKTYVHSYYNDDKITELYIRSNQYHFIKTLNDII